VELEKVKIRRIIGPTPSGAAVLLGNEKKTFVVFVGFYEAAALVREINDETPARPLTHDLMQSVFLGFDVEVKQVIISTIIENTFCATLILQQRLTEAEAESEHWVGRRNEVRIDARPSDCLVLALKNKVDICVTREVFDQVQDVSNMATEGGEEGDLTMESLEFEFNPKLSFVQESFDQQAMEFTDPEEELDLGDDLGDELGEAGDGEEEGPDSAFGGGRHG
jgi:bifunctional DNase/RNase